MATIACQSGATLENQPLPQRGDPALLTGIRTPLYEGNGHVPQGTVIQYFSQPPVSGPHYPVPTKPGFYTESQPAGNLVHALEHGNVVIYYHPDRLTREVEASLKAFVKAHPGINAGVIAMPGIEYKSPYILTAWKYLLEMDTYDALAVRAFLAEYLGRGPEVRVR